MEKSNKKSVESNRKSVGFHDETTGMFLYEGEFTYLLSPAFPKEEIKLRYMKYNVLKFLNKGGNPKSIARDLGIRRPTVLQHLDELEKTGLVDFEKENGKRKYACPHFITEKGKFLVEKSVGFPVKSSRVGKTKRGTLKGKEDDVNGHAFVFTLIIPKELNEWKDRRKILDERNIEYDKLGHLFHSEGERLIINGRKIHFTNKSIVIYESAEYIAKLSKQSKSKAIYHFEIFLKIFEKILGMNIKHTISESTSGYKYRVSRQHYALIQNSLAKQYNAKDKKLEVYNGRGRLMYLIDNSQTLDHPKGENHLEAVDPKTSDEDITPAQNFFKKLPEYPITTEDIHNKLENNDEKFKKIKNDFEETKKLLEESSKIGLASAKMTVENSKQNMNINLVMKQMDQNIRQLMKIVIEGRK